MYSGLGLRVSGSGFSKECKFLAPVASVSWDQGVDWVLHSGD